MAACGGGGGDDNANPLAGRFVDGPVAGLDWETPSEFGRTDGAGTFFYRPGEGIDFWIGDVWLGRAPAAPVLTPMDLFPEATEVDHPAVTNLARFLQTLDADGAPENGIQIPALVHAAAEGRDIDFSAPVGIFDRTPALIALLAAAEAGGAFPEPGPRQVVGAESARRHLAQTLAELANAGGDPPGGDGSDGEGTGSDGGGDSGG